MHYPERPNYQGLMTLCSASQFHKVISAHLGHFTSALDGQISQSIPLSPYTAHGALCQHDRMILFFPLFG